MFHKNFKGEKTMKRTTLFSKVMGLAIAGIFIATTSMAGLPAKPWAIHYQKIQDKIAQTVKFPDECFAKGAAGETAEVIFVLDENGKMVVENVICACPELGKSIREQLSDVTCPDAMHPYNQHYKITIKFLNCS